MFGSGEIIIVLVIVLLVFGGSQLPKLAKNLGKAQKEFKDGRRRRTTSQGADRRRSSQATAAVAASDAAGQHATAPAARQPIGWPSCSPTRPAVTCLGDGARRGRGGASGSGGARARCSRPTRRVRCGARARARGIGLDRAAGADLAGLVDADAVAGEERRRAGTSGSSERHPSVVESGSVEMKGDRPSDAVSSALGVDVAGVPGVDCSCRVLSAVGGDSDRSLTLHRLYASHS